MHFAPREPFPPQSWARCSNFALARLARCRRSLVKRAVLRTLLRCRRHGIPRPGFHHRPPVAPQRQVAVTLDLPQSVVAAGFRTCEQSVEALESVGYLPSSVSAITSSIVSCAFPKRAGDFFLCCFPFGRPVGGKLPSILVLVTKPAHHLVKAAANRAPQKPSLQSAQPKTSQDKSMTSRVRRSSIASLGWAAATIRATWVAYSASCSPGSKGAGAIPATRSRMSLTAEGWSGACQKVNRFNVCIGAL